MTRPGATTYFFEPGGTPLLLSIPHAGTFVPEEIQAHFSTAGLALPDTDWHLERLYDFARAYNVNLLIASCSRYVIDLNRPPDDTPLYTGPTTGLCPTRLFDGRPLYRPGHTPDASEIRQRLETYWLPYHTRLRETIDALRRRFGFAVVYDAHSICAEIPTLFDGVLPDFNLGTNEGLSTAASLAHQVYSVCKTAGPRFSAVENGRFTGGYITRHYGQPAQGVHALQMELGQRTYMDENPPYTFRTDQALALQPILEAVFATILDWCEARRQTNNP